MHTHLYESVPFLLLSQSKGATLAETCRLALDKRPATDLSTLSAPSLGLHALTPLYVPRKGAWRLGDMAGARAVKEKHTAYLLQCSNQKREHERYMSKAGWTLNPTTSSSSKYSTSQGPTAQHVQDFVRVPSSPAAFIQATGRWGASPRIPGCLNGLHNLIDARSNVSRNLECSIRVQLLCLFAQCVFELLQGLLITTHCDK